MWIDSHAHLFDKDDRDLETLIKEAATANVRAIVSTGTDCETSRNVVRQCTAFAQLWGAVGVSPFDVVNLPGSWFDDLCSLLDHPKVIAVGETGIDATNPRYPSLSLQRPVFEQQLAAARDRHLPVIIHSRGAEVDAVAICKDANVEHALFHCFTGNRDALRRIVDNGYYVSISGIITFPRSDLRSIIGSIPPERLCIETDTPYLAPVPHRGKKNRPAWVRLVGEEIARLTGTPDDVLQYQLEKNFRQLFTKYRPEPPTEVTNSAK